MLNMKVKIILKIHLLILYSYQYLLISEYLLYFMNSSKMFHKLSILMDNIFFILKTFPTKIQIFHFFLLFYPSNFL